MPSQKSFKTDYSQFILENTVKELELALYCLPEKKQLIRASMVKKLRKAINSLKATKLSHKSL